MRHLMPAVIDGFNKMMAEQKADPSPCFVSLVLFDHEYQEVFIDRPLAEVPGLTAAVCFARGDTHLFDALGRAVSSLGARIDALPPAKQPEKVIVVVHTDGAENGSTESTAASVSKLVKEQQEEASWLFVFAGANIDAFAAGGQVGFVKGATAHYQGTVMGTAALYGSTSAAVLRSRGMKHDQYKSVVRGVEDVFLANEVSAMATGDSSLLNAVDGGGASAAGAKILIDATANAAAASSAKKSAKTSKRLR